MFIDDLDNVKRVLRRLNEEIGVYSVEYQGINEEHVNSFGDNFDFLCELDKFLRYCEDNNLEYSKEIHKSSLGDYNLAVLSIDINGNKYSAIEKSDY